jgi:hypothetical protein
MKRLITAHKILIAAAVAFFVYLSIWEYRNYLNTQDGWSAFRAGLYILVALGFGVYFTKIRQWYK